MTNRTITRRRVVQSALALTQCTPWAHHAVHGQERAELDADGVRMLLPTAAGGTVLRLAAQNPNNSAEIDFDYKIKATSGNSAGIVFWTMPSVALDYSSGSKGYTARVHLHAAGAQQNFNWKTQKGYLSTPKDVRNQEFTVYVRVHELLTPAIAQAALKIRGGGHHANDPDAASCTMMTFAPSSHKSITRFGKELSHPIYDYVNLKPMVNTSLQDNVWVGLKLLSWSDPKNPTQVINQLHIDIEPFDAAGKPMNQWRQLSEYTDAEGKSSGQYTKLVDWGALQTTLRVDGYRSVDFAHLSVREITPP
jgi:hypothetical protein